MYKYTAYDTIPQTIIDYILTVSGAVTIYDVTLKEINGLLNGLIEFYKDEQEDFI